MEVPLTKPIEEFIHRQVARGYADAGEVARQAFLRWMEEEDQIDPDPPRLLEKLQAARQGKFQSYDPEKYDAFLSEANDTSR